MADEGQSRRGQVWGGGLDRPAGRLVRRMLGMGMIMCAGGGIGAQGASAQTPAAPVVRLTVDPRAMATATTTAQAGPQTLDGQPMQISMAVQQCEQRGCGAYSIASTPMVYVPKQCVGARRCPLIVLSNAPIEYYAQIADKYGMLVANVKVGWNSSRTDPAITSQQLRQVLATFAVDLDKIVIAGRCATGQVTVDLGAQNLDIFSRIVVGTQHIGDPPVRGPKQTTEYNISGGLMEYTAEFWGVRKLRERGYPVKWTLQFRGHSHTYEDYDFIGHWLQESWAIPDPAARPAPPVFSDLPLLTPEILTQMTAFWARFQQEPDSIRTTARRALVREVVVGVGKEQFSTLMVDMPALAARYPSVAAAFQAAKLTPKQHELYRATLASALVYKRALATLRISADSVAQSLGIEPTSTVAKNLQFMDTHPDEFKALDATNMWYTP